MTLPSYPACGLTYGVFVVGVEPTSTAGLMPLPLVLSQSTVPLAPSQERTWSPIPSISKCICGQCVPGGGLTIFQLDQYVVPFYGCKFQTQAEGAWFLGSPPFQRSRVYGLRHRTKNTFGRMFLEESYVRGMRSKNDILVVPYVILARSTHAAQRSML